MTNDTDLDAVHTRLCTTMTGVGDADANLFLARFALLVMTRLGEREAFEDLIDAAGVGGKGNPAGPRPQLAGEHA